MGVPKKPQDVVTVITSNFPSYCSNCGKKISWKKKTQKLKFKEFYPYECPSCFTWYQYMNKSEIIYVSLAWRIKKHTEEVN